MTKLDWNLPQTRHRLTDWSKRDRAQSNRTTPRPDHQAHWYRDRKRSSRRRESPPARASGKKLIRRRSRTRYLINFYCLFYGGCKLIYCPVALTRSGTRLSPYGAHATYGPRWNRHLRSDVIFWRHWRHSDVISAGDRNSPLDNRVRVRRFKIKIQNYEIATIYRNKFKFGSWL